MKYLKSCDTRLITKESLATISFISNVRGWSHVYLISLFPPEDCPVGTYNKLEGKKVLGDCATCAAGYYCSSPAKERSVCLIIRFANIILYLQRTFFRRLSSQIPAFPFKYRPHYIIKVTLPYMATTTPGWKRRTNVRQVSSVLQEPATIPLILALPVRMEGFYHT